MRTLVVIGVLLSHVMAFSQSLKEQKKFWKQMAKEMPEFKKVFKKHKKYRFEIIYGQVNHEPGKPPSIQKFYFGDPNQYFYPASTVKLPVALKTLQLLNEYADSIGSGTLYAVFNDSVCGGQHYKSIAQKYLRMHEPLHPSKAAALCGLTLERFCFLNRWKPDRVLPEGRVTLASSDMGQININELLCEMLLYSNNYFYNHLFDFSYGQTCAFNEKVKITTRFMPCLGEHTEETVKSWLANEQTFKLIPIKSQKITDFSKRIFDYGYKVGKGVMVDGQLVKEPKSFERHNAIQLETLQNMLIEVLYPGYLPEGTFFSITEEQRKLLIRYLSMKPKEDKIVTDSAYLKVPDDYTNYLYTGQKHEDIPAHIRMVNIVGQAYGFITDCMYFVDEKEKVDFFLAARIYVNKDEVLNDDKYEYNEIAFPLFEQLGKHIYEFEKKREKEYQTNLGWLFQIFR